MSLKAQVRTDSRGNVVVHMEGGLDYENTFPFRKELEDLIATNPSSTITLDLNRLDFVGSSGIGFFVETIRSFNKQKDQIRLQNVKTEFLKVFKLYEFDAFSLMCEQFDTDETETLNTQFGNRKNTFQN